MGGATKDFGRTGALQQLGTLGDGTAGVNHVIDEDGGFANNIANHS